LTRAKKKIVVAGIPLGAPVGDELRSRLQEVCRTIYLAFTAGYTPGDGAELLRADLAGEAVRLAALLHELVPDEPAPQAVLALLLLQHSRRDARQAGGRLVMLSDQDRALWHRDEIDAALTLISSLRPATGYAEELRLQALIAVEHASAPSADETDWVAIADYYETLEILTGSAIVRLNRAVAAAEVDGPDAGLALLEGLESVLPDNHRVDAIRAELAARTGDAELARASLERALQRCSNQVERAHLAERLAAIAPKA
jgi:RNA polymerase sigma-70 factor (ECF subfamily)